MAHPPPMLDWSQIDTVMLDMDGCLLDLNYDNRLWNDLVPSRYGQAHRVSEDTARQRLYGHLQDGARELNFYCIDFWTRRTQLDIIALHHEMAHLIIYRPGAKAFLRWLRTKDLRVLLVTNAHRLSLAVKDRHSGLCSLVHRTISSHDFGCVKQSTPFWERLAEAEPFDPAHTLFIDDNQPVLEAAAAFGIAHLLTVAQPDSNRPRQRRLRFPAFNHFAEIMEGAVPDKAKGGAAGG